MSRSRQGGGGFEKVAAPDTSPEPSATSGGDAPAPGDPGEVGMAPEGAGDALARATRALMGGDEGSGGGAPASGELEKINTGEAPETSAETAAAALVSPELARIKERERALADQSASRERELKAREAKLQETVAAEAEKVVKERLDAIMRRATRDPLSFYRELGVDKDFTRIAEQLYAGDLESPPEDILARRQQLEFEDRIAALERREKEFEERIARERQAAEEQKMVEAYRDKIRGELSQIPSDLRYLQHVAKERPAETLNSLLAIAEQHAQTTGQAAAPAELFKTLEAALEKQANLYKPLFSAAQATSAPAPSSPPAPSNIDTATHTSRVAAEKFTEEERLARAKRILETGGPL